jgi:hypothetical protein
MFCKETKMGTIILAIGINLALKSSYTILCTMYKDQTTDWTTDEPVLDSQKGPEIFLFFTALRQALMLTQPPMQ